MNPDRPYSIPEQAQFALECCSTPMTQVEQPVRFQDGHDDYMAHIHGHRGTPCVEGECICGCGTRLDCMILTGGIDILHKIALRRGGNPKPKHTDTSKPNEVR